MDTQQQRREDGEERAEKVRRDQACRLESDPRGAGQGGQDQDKRRSDLIIIMNRYFNF